MTPLAPLVIGPGVALAVMVSQTVAPGSDIANTGAMAVLGAAFLYFMWALTQNRIVSRDAAKIESDLVKLSQDLVVLTQQSLERGERVEELAKRNLSWLEGRAGK